MAISKAPCSWFAKLSSRLLEFGFFSSKADSSLLIYRQKNLELFVLFMLTTYLSLVLLLQLILCYTIFGLAYQSKILANYIIFSMWKLPLIRMEFFFHNKIYLGSPSSHQYDPCQACSHSHVFLSCSHPM